MNEILNLSAKQLAQRIAKREISPLECVEAHIQQIEKVNPSLNALVEDDFAEARRTAQAQTEKLIQTQELPPLYGVPFTVKEMLAYKDFKSTAGSIHRKDYRRSEDASILARLRQAGGIPLGTTNVPELGFWFETFNPVYGRTNNPYDVNRTPGGSSGGEGALIASGASPFGLGSDIGGSVRIPAAYCGIFGHKPSRFLVPFTGHFPYYLEVMKETPTATYPYTTNGVLSRKAEDLRFILEMIKGPDGIDPQTLAIDLQQPVSSWKGRKVLLCPSPRIHLATSVSHEIAESVQTCGELFKQLGADVEELDEKFFLQAVRLWFAALRSSRGNKSFYELLSNGEEINFVQEFARLAIGEAHYTLPNLLLSLGEVLEKKFKKNPPDQSRKVQKLHSLVESLKQKLGPEGILICPAQPSVAPVHRALLWSPFDYIYSGIFTMMGLPSSVAPMGLNQNGLPKAVQIVANHAQDHLTLSCAELLESTFGGWQPPHLSTLVV